MMACVLAISSHVAYGSVGLAAIVPALHWLGHDVIAVPTVVLSNHPGYARFAGAEVPAAQIAHMLEALEANGRLAETTAIISGYLPTPAHVTAVRAGVERVRNANRDALFLCDPVFGDEPEGLYLAPGVATAVRDSLLPLADITTPNRFELSWLSGMPVEDPQQGRVAAEALGISRVLATSVPASDNRLANVLVSGDEASACFVRRRPAAPHGTGDLLAAMYLGNQLNGASRAYCLGAAASAVDASVAASMGRNELTLAATGPLWTNARVLPTVPV
jgi:pyridoxine kinase